MDKKLAIKPLGSKVLILPDPIKQRTTATGIIIPLSNNSPLDEGTVMLVADMVVNLNPGDKVLYPRGGGIPITLDEIDYRFLNGPTEKDPGDIIAINI